MAYSNDTKPSGSYTSDTKAISGVVVGNPIGLLLALTFAADTQFYSFDSEPSAVSYTNDSKP